MVVKRFEVYWASLDPTVGSKIRKTHPCVVVSNHEANRGLRTVIIAPFTSARKDYPSWVKTNFMEREGSINLDQIRVVDKSRLKKKLVRSIGQHKPSSCRRYRRCLRNKGTDPLIS